MAVHVLHRSPLVATVDLPCGPDASSWSSPRFPGVAKLVEALASVQSKNPVGLSELQRLEEKVRAVAPVEVVNPRGQADDDVGMDAEMDAEDDLPCMDRFEVVFDATWAPDLARASEAFRDLAAEMTRVARDHARPQIAATMEEYWRLIVSFPGTGEQRWYADDVSSGDIITVETPLTGAARIVFPLDDAGAPVDIEGNAASEFATDRCVMYSGDAVHFYGAVAADAPAPCVTLQLVMSANGDPNDGIPSESYDSDEADEDDA